MAAPEVGGSAVVQEAAVTVKPKRVRTGCLTCRERHLKCDEALPHCQNCKKSNRVCKRGLKLNFIDITCQTPPFFASSNEWKISFTDESRDIASEYQGGLQRYAHLDPAIEEEPVIMQNNIDPQMQFDYPQNAPPAPSMSYQELPPIHGLLPDSGYSEDPSAGVHVKYDHHQQDHYHQDNQSNPSPFTQNNTLQQQQQQQQQQHHGSISYSHHEQETDPSDEKREYLNTQEEVLFMQVFVEEVGIWMDSMDPMKHVSMVCPLIDCNNTDPTVFSSFAISRFTRADVAQCISCLWSPPSNSHQPHLHRRKSTILLRHCNTPSSQKSPKS